MTKPKIHPELTADWLREFLSYDPETGVFIRRVAVRRGNAGDVAGYKTASGYRSITINRRQHREHRLAWLYVYGEWPTEQLDHINGIRGDNRIANLREATNQQNQQNVGLRADNKSGYIGVCFDKWRGLWRSEIRSNKKRRTIGFFKTAEEAAAAYACAKKQLHTFQPFDREIPQ